MNCRLVEMELETRNLNMAKFDFEDFVLCPTVEQFDRCRKDNLLLLADFFHVSVPRSTNKREIKTVLYEELVGQRILPYDAFTGVASEVEKPQTLKELELELSRQEHQNQFLQLQAIELQTDHQVKLRELELR